MVKTISTDKMVNVMRLAFMVLLFLLKEWVRTCGTGLGWVLLRLPGFGLTRSGSGLDGWPSCFLFDLSCPVSALLDCSFGLSNNIMVVLCSCNIMTYPRDSAVINA